MWLVKSWQWDLLFKHFTWALSLRCNIFYVTFFDFTIASLIPGTDTIFFWVKEVFRFCWHHCRVFRKQRCNYAWMLFLSPRMTFIGVNQGPVGLQAQCSNHAKQKRVFFSNTKYSVHIDKNALKNAIKK